MNNSKRVCTIAKIVLPFLLTCASFAQTQPQPGMAQQRFQQMQQALAANSQRLHQYQWIETNTVSINGEPRPPKRSTCKYGPDGTVQKTPLGQQEAAAEQQAPMLPLRGGLIRRLVTKKKKDEYEKDATQIRTLAALYIPFSRDKLREALMAGRASLEQDGTNDETAVIKDYAKPGDQVRITLSRTTKQIEQVSIQSYFEKPSQVLTANVQFFRLSDGTNHPSYTTINAPSKNMAISIVNSDYSRVTE